MQETAKLKLAALRWLHVAYAAGGANYTTRGSPAVSASALEIAGLYTRRSKSSMITLTSIN